MSIAKKQTWLKAHWKDLPTLNLIDTAIERALTFRTEWNEQTNGIKEGLTPLARRSTQYLRIRESINRGCREAVKQIPEPNRRSIAYAILMKATYLIFHQKKTQELMDTYNTLLDEMVGTH